MATSQDGSRPKLYVLDYGAGNVRSLANSIERLGYEFEWIQSVEDFDKAEVSWPLVCTATFDVTCPQIRGMI